MHALSIINCWSQSIQCRQQIRQTIMLVSESVLCDKRESYFPLSDLSVLQRLRAPSLWIWLKGYNRCVVRCPCLSSFFVDRRNSATLTVNRYHTLCEWASENHRQCLTDQVDTFLRIIGLISSAPGKVLSFKFCERWETLLLTNWSSWSSVGRMYI